jgi:RNA polymerase sigma-70 factor, ECF subfamily
MQTMGGETITELLRLSREGDRAALDRLTPLVYQQLHRIAEGILRAERSDHTLTATALLHEAWMRLAGSAATQPDYRDRNHFFAIVAKKMRHLLVDHAREKLSQKRGAGVPREQLHEKHAAAAVATAGDPETILLMNDLLDQLEAWNPRRARFFEMRFFGGMTQEEIAETENVSSQTVYRELRVTQAWLMEQMR